MRGGIRITGVIIIKADERRNKLVQLLKKSGEPIIGSRLAERFDVSRQVIVQDIALLRAAGERILATSRGYLIQEDFNPEMVRTQIACRHSDDEVKEELMTIVSYGGKVIDVIVEHPIYGELSGLLMIQTPSDVEQFMDRYLSEDTSLLCDLTDGVHLHTVEAMNERVINRIKQGLDREGFLL